MNISELSFGARLLGCNSENLGIFCNINQVKKQAEINPTIPKGTCRISAYIGCFRTWATRTSTATRAALAETNIKKLAAHNASHFKPNLRLSIQVAANKKSVPTNKVLIPLQGTSTWAMPFSKTMIS